MTATHGTRRPVRTKGEWRQIVEGLVGIPVTEGNRIDVLRNGDEIFPAMLQSIEDAQRTVDFLTYVYWSGDIARRFADTLSRRAEDGLRVRILLDAVGSATMDLRLIRQMRDAGCHVERFRPPSWRLWEVDHRTHRKVLVCDEEVAYTGGVGIAEEWEGDARGPDEWRDTHFRLRGPAVDGLRASFLSHWFETGNGLFDEHDAWPSQDQIGDALVQVLRTPAQYGYTDMALMFRALVDLSESCVRMATAYFVPDDDFCERLGRAAQRGVEVELLLPGEHHDKRIVQAAGEDRYDELLDAGVRIHRYDRTMLHAKIMTVDGLVSFVGSANADHRSMRLNAENNLLVIDEELTGKLDHHYDDDLRHASTVKAGQWARRSLAQRAFETVTSLFDERL